MTQEHRSVIAKQRKAGISIFDREIVRQASIDAVKKLSPLHLLANPVILVVEIGAVIATVMFLQELAGQRDEPRFFTAAVAVWLWFTVLFANFAEAMAEGRGKAQAKTLRAMRRETMAKRETDGGLESVPASALRKGDIIRVEAGEDVEQILDAGIKVVSTLNIQHLESLNDVVEAITGIRVRETIPDSVVDNADELILIDLSPEGARARMQHGHIYPQAQAQAALENFFRADNLAALRELALRRTAQEVEVQLDEYMREAARHAAVDERVLVFVDETPFSRTLIRRGWRVAQGLRADLLVAYLKRDIDQTAQAELSRTLDLAEDLNARVCPLAAADATATLTAFIEAEGVNHLILPYRRRTALDRLVKRSLADQLMIALPHLDVHLVGGQ